MDIEELKKNLQTYLNEQKEQWPHLIYAGGGFYQSLKEIGIDGKRNTEERFKIYEIQPYLKKNLSTLDIGANTGFFSIYISKFVKECDCVEINPSLVKVGKEVAKFLKRPVNFYIGDFGKFKTDKKYDIIMSFAADEVADRLNTLNFQKYIDKILSLLNDRGLIFFESQAEDILRNKFGPKLDYIAKKFDILLKKEIGSTYPVKVPTRVFIIGRKKT